MDKHFIGSNIRKERRQKHIRQTELAKNSGISNSYLSDIENNRTIPSLKTLLRICTALDTDLSKMLLPIE